MHCLQLPLAGGVPSGYHAEMNGASTSSGLELLDYLAVAAYLAVTLAILYRAGRKQHDTEDFFLGGRSMPWLAVGLSIMATLLSTNTYLGAPGEMIRYGPAYFFGFLAYPLAALIVLTLWIPFFMRLRLEPTCHSPGQHSAAKSAPPAHSSHLLTVSL